MDLFIHVLSAVYPANPAKWTECARMLERNVKMAKTSNMQSVIHFTHFIGMSARLLNVLSSYFQDCFTFLPQNHYNRHDTEHLNLSVAETKSHSLVFKCKIMSIFCIL